MLEGGGVPEGQVIGASDRIGESQAATPVTPNNLVCKIYSLLGIDPSREFSRELKTSNGRPIATNQGGTRYLGTGRMIARGCCRSVFAVGRIFVMALGGGSVVTKPPIKPCD